MFFWSMNISVRADDFAAVGGFDERFRDWGAEDVELAYRVAPARGAVGRRHPDLGGAEPA